MPYETVRAREGAQVNVCVRLTGALKNSILDAAEAAGVSLNNWLTHAIYQQLTHGDHRPEMKPMPTPHEVIADYLQGRVTMSPCGKPYPCEGAGQTESLHGVTWCTVCRVVVQR